MILVCIVNPFVLIILVPIVFGFIFLRREYMASAREVRRYNYWMLRLNNTAAVYGSYRIGSPFPPVPLIFFDCGDVRV